MCERGLKVIPLSVDLWIHYINLLLGTLNMNLPESTQRIRRYHWQTSSPFFPKMQFQLPFLFSDIIRPSLLLVFCLLLEITDFVWKSVGTDVELTLQGNRERREMWDSIWAVGMGRFTDSLGASAKQDNDTMHQFKKCASDTSWHLVSRCSASNIFASVKPDLFIYNY